jgi:hypothetical protein
VFGRIDLLIHISYWIPTFGKDFTAPHSQISAHSPPNPEWKIHCTTQSNFRPFTTKPRVENSMHHTIKFPPIHHQTQSGKFTAPHNQISAHSPPNPEWKIHGTTQSNFRPFTTKTFVSDSWL